MRARLLLAVLFAATAVAWLPDRWPVSIVEAGSFLLAASCLFGRVDFDVAMLPVAGMVVIGLLQLATGRTAAESETLRATLGWLANLAVLFASVQVFRSTVIREKALRALLGFGVVLSIVATLQFFTGQGKVYWLFPIKDPEFLMGTFVYHNQYAAVIELLLPLALLPALEDPRRRVMYSLAAGAMIASVVVSASRGGAILTAAEVAVLLAIRWRKKSRRTLLVMAAVTAGMVAVVGWNALIERLQLNDPYLGRREMLQASVAMFSANPLSGVGLGNWPSAYPMYAIYDDGLIANQAHNDWVQWACEGGVFALLCTFVLFVVCLRRARLQPWSIGLVFVMIHALFDYPFAKPQISMLFFLLLGASAQRWAIVEPRAANRS